MVEIHADPNAPAGPQFGPPAGLASCQELARVPALGRCAPGATVATVPLFFGAGGVVSHQPSRAGLTLPAPATPGDRLADLPVQSLYVGTDGSRTAIERARTAIEAAFPYLGSPSTIGDMSAENSQLVAGWRQLADVAIVASLVIAACSLAVSAASGLVERKRPFSLLRLTGAPLDVLRRVVALEAAVPLLAVALVSAGTGLLAAHLFLRSQLDESLRLPGPGYYVVVVAGLSAALGIIASTFPLLARITGPEAARNE